MKWLKNQLLCRAQGLEMQKPVFSCVHVKTQSVKGVTEAEALHLQDVQHIGGVWSMDVGAQHCLLLLLHSSLGLWLREVLS